MTKKNKKLKRPIKNFSLTTTISVPKTNKITKARKREIDKALEIAVNRYGKTLKLLQFN